MNTKTWIPLACAIGLGLVAAFVAKRSMHNNAAANMQETIQVAVAKDAIAPGTALAAEDISTVAISGKVAPAQTFTSAAELVGRVTASPMLPGQPFTAPLLAAQGVPAGLAALVPTGMRAVTVDVSESAAMAGLLAPGSRVDVVATNVNHDHPEKTATRTFVQNVVVLAVGQRLGSAPKPDPEKEAQVYRTVTLLASLHDSEALDLALTMTRVRLVLRATGDQAELADDGINAGELCHMTSDNKDTVLPTSVAPQVLAPTAVAAATPPSTQPSTTEKPSIFGSTNPTAPVPTRIVTLILGTEEHQISFPDPTAATATAAAPTESTGTPSGLGNTPNGLAIPQ